MSENVLLVENRGRVRILTLNRPHKVNALSTGLTSALHDALVEVSEDTSVGAVVLAGAGRGFCSGADVTEFAGLSSDSDQALSRARLTHRLHLALHRVPQPVVGAVHGPALGGGAGLALGCDVIVVGSDVALGFPEISHGIVPAIVMASLQRNVGSKLAFEMVSLGAPLGAEALVGAGLARSALDPARVLERAIEIADTWAGRNPSAMRTVKELFRRVEELHYEAALDAGRDANVIMRNFSRP